MKDCRHIEKLIYPYLDGELNVSQNLVVEAHILDCRKCCDLLNSEKRFLSLLKSACLRHEGPVALKAKIKRRIEKKQRSFFRLFSGPIYKMTYAAAVAGLLIFLFAGRLMYMGTDVPPPFVRASVENHLQYINGNLPLEIKSHDPRVVTAWIKKSVAFMPSLPVLDDEKVVLLGGRIANFKGDPMALITFRVEKRPVTMLIIKENPDAFVKSSHHTFLHGKRFNFSSYEGLNTISWTDDGNNYTLISRMSVRDIKSCNVCHARGSGLSDLKALLGI